MPGFFGPYYDDNGNPIVPAIPGAPVQMPMIQDPTQGPGLGPLMPPDFSSGASLPMGNGAQFSQGPAPGGQDVLPPGVTVREEPSDHGNIPLPGQGTAPSPGTGATPPQPPGGAPDDGLPQVPGMGRPPRTPAEADAQENQAYNNYAGAKLKAGEADIAAKQSAAQRIADAAKGDVEEHERAEAEAKQIRQTFAAKADQDLAAWSTKMSDAANAKEDPRHYWHDESTWGKVAWIVSLVAGAASAGADQTKNIGLTMLSQEIDKDIARQRDQIQRRMEGVKAEGDVLRAKQARDLGFANDEIAERFQRNASIQKYALAKAQVPGQDDKKAALLGLASDLDGEQMKLTMDRGKQFHQEWQAKAQRAVEYSRITAENERAKADRQERAREADQTIQKDYDTAQLELAGKVATAKGAAAGAAGNTLAFDPNASGVMLVDKAGKPAGRLAVPKEFGEKAAEIVQNGVRLSNGIQDIKKALSDSNTFDFEANRDNAVRSAVASVVEPLVKQQGGRLTPEAIEAVQEQLLGEKMSSFIDRTKGASRDEIVALLDKRLADLPGRIMGDLGSYPGIELPEGTSIAFTPTDTLAPTTGHASAEDNQARAGAPAVVPPIKDTADYYKRQVSGQPIPSLPPKVQAKIADRLGGGALSVVTPEGWDKVIKQTLADVKDQPPGVQEQVKQEAYAARAKALATLEHMEVILSTPGVYDPSMGPNDVVDYAQKHGDMKISREDALKILKDVDDRVTNGR